MPPRNRKPEEKRAGSEPRVLTARAYIRGGLLAGVGTAGDIAGWAGCSRNNVYTVRAILVAKMRAAGKPADLPVGLRHAGRVSHSPSVHEVEAHLRRIKERRDWLRTRLNDRRIETLAAPGVLRAMRQELAVIEGRNPAATRRPRRSHARP